MHPLLTVIEIGDRALPIGSYGSMLCLALGLAGFGALRSARAAGLDMGACIATLGVVIAAGFTGAALLHAGAQVLRAGALSAIAGPPGLAFFGGAIAATVALLACGRLFGLPALLLADAAVPYLCGAHALGRIGCLLGGCCYGAHWHGPFAITYDDPFAPVAALGTRHALPLYEGLALLALAGLFALRAPRDPGSGRRFFAYAAAYGALRLLLEPLRGDAARGVFLDGALSTSQVVAALVLCVAIAARARARQRRGRPAMLATTATRSSASTGLPM